MLDAPLHQFHFTGYYMMGLGAFLLLLAAFATMGFIATKRSPEKAHSANNFKPLIALLGGFGVLGSVAGIAQAVFASVALATNLDGVWCSGWHQTLSWKYVSRVELHEPPVPSSRDHDRLVFVFDSRHVSEVPFLDGVKNVGQVNCQIDSLNKEPWVILESVRHDLQTSRDRDLQMSRQ